MKHRMTVAFFVLAALSLFSMVALAQHTQHHPTQTPSKVESKAEKSAAMTAHQQEMQGLVDQLLQGAEAMQDEKDPGVLKKKIVEHRALLEQLQSRMKQCSNTTARMDEHMKMCPMMRSGKKQD